MDIDCETQEQIAMEARDFVLEIARKRSLNEVLSQSAAPTSAHGEKYSALMGNYNPY
jgi:hypothetical protein